MRDNLRLRKSNMNALDLQVVYLKGLGVISFICISFSTLIIALSPQTSGYEISIYEAYPQYLWYALTIAITCGILILLSSSLILKKETKMWLIGLGIVILSNLTILLLPLFRGYHIAASGDEISHVGFIKDISLSHHIGQSNYYPMNHIVTYDFATICGLDTFTVLKIVPSIYYLVYLMGLYLVAKRMEIGKGGRSAILTMAFASPLLFTYFNYLYLPTHFFLELIPLTVYILLQWNDKREYRTIRGTSFSILLILFLILAPLTHPLGSLFLVGILILFKLSSLIHTALSKRVPRTRTSINFSSVSVTIPMLIVSMTLLVWFTQFTLFQYTSEKAIQFFLTFEGTSPLNETASTLESTGLSYLEIAKLIFTNYGHIAIYTLLTIVALYIILKDLHRREIVPDFQTLFLGIMFVSFTVFYIATLGGDFFITGRSIRIYCWALVPAIILCGSVYSQYIKAQKRYFKELSAITVSLLIISAAIIGIFSVYFSPYILQGDPQVSSTEWSGVEWFFSNKGGYNTVYFDQTPYRAPFALYGLDGTKPDTTGRFVEVPKHLGYNSVSSISYYYASDMYAIISERARSAKTQLWPDCGRFTLIELNRLYDDGGVDKVFDNSGLDILRINSKRGAL